MRSLNIKYIPELDQLRGIAALLVLFFHGIAGGTVAGQYMAFSANAVPIPDNPLALILANGFTGVALFFVISGFLFTWGALQVDKYDWKKFYTNRILRIFPLYILMLLVVYSLSRGEFTFMHFLQSLTGFGNLTFTQGYFDIVLWTISIELQFYMLFPFLVSLLKRRGVWYIVGLIAIMVMLRFIARLDQLAIHDAVYWTLLGRLDQFLIGMVLAWVVYRRGWLRANAIARVNKAKLVYSAKLITGLILIVAVMLGLFWLYTKVGWKYGNSYLQVVWPTLEGSMWAAFGLFYVGIVMLHRPKFLKAIQFIGVISYSLYLLHYPIFRAIHSMNLDLVIPGHKLASGLLTTTLEVLPATIIASLLTYYIIEKPPLDMRKQYATFSPDKTKQPPVVSGSDA